MVVFKVKKEDYPVVIGAITGLIGLYRYSLVLGILTILLAILSKHTKSTYWKGLIFVGILNIVVYLIKTFWPGV